MRSIPVYNPHRLVSAKGSNRELSPSPPFHLCVFISSPSLRPLRFSQLCCWSHECQSQSSSQRPVSASLKRLARSPLASFTRIRTHIHTLSLSPSSRLCAFAFPSGLRTRPNLRTNPQTHQRDLPSSLHRSRLTLEEKLRAVALALGSCTAYTGKVYCLAHRFQPSSVGIMVEMMKWQTIIRF